MGAVVISLVFDVCPLRRTDAVNRVRFQDSVSF